MARLDNGQPLWLPKGSIRAILALEIVSSSIAMIFVGVAIPAWWEGLAIGVGAAYFIQKALSSAVGFVKNGMTVNGNGNGS